MHKSWMISWAIFLFAFATLAILVVGGHTQSFNESLTAQIHCITSPLLTNTMIFISNLGQWFIYAPLSLLFLLIPKSRKKIGVPVAITISISAILNELLKRLFAIARPDIHRLVQESGYGFPSGHAMNGTVFIGLCAYLFIQYSYKKPLKISVIVLSVVFMLLMGFSRVYLGVHTPTDVLGGYLMGGIVLLPAGQSFKK